MSSTLAKLSHFSRSALLGLLRSPFVHGAAVLTLATALFATGLTQGAVASMESLVGSLQEGVEVTVYVQEGLSEEQVGALEKSVEQLTGGVPRKVTPDQALKRLSEELGDLGAALDGLPKNPLPLSLEVAVAPAHRSSTAMSDLAIRLGRLPGVSEVDYGAQAVERLSSLARALKVGSWVAFLLVALTAVVVVSATLQLAIYARREEIEIQKLVGATNWFVKAPFLLEGLTQGILGAAIGSVALWFFAHWASTHLALYLSPLFPPGTLRFDWSSVLWQMFGAGMGLGLLGSFVAVGRFL